MQQLYAWTGLGRPLSHKWFTHRLVFICLAAAFLIAAGMHLAEVQDGLYSAAVFGLRITFAVFFSWAITRELDPDEPWAAIVAVGLASAGLWFWPYPHLKLFFLVLLLLRLINRSTGVEAKIPDVLLILLLTAWLLYEEQLIAGAFAALALWSNGRLPNPQAYHKYLALAIALLTVLAAMHYPAQRVPNELSMWINISIITLATGFALFSRQLKKVKSTADATTAPLSIVRVKAAQLIALLVFTVFSLWYGDWLFVQIITIWATFGAIFLYAALNYKTSLQR
ncbi:hypothetical protein [Cesiribacter sp. SM1]|uniref:hypothetical protein n=1 Tax=Cesiribacter sp. SM1 TaxID=2861196 RepID=UPI001CD5C12A|nr:hypothetical protein [Cesiribacter sp. SM1]